MTNASNDTIVNDLTATIVFEWEDGETLFIQESPIIPRIGESVRVAWAGNDHNGIVVDIRYEFISHQSTQSENMNGIFVSVVLRRR